MNESFTSAEISDQIAALRRQTFTLLLALVIVSGTLTVYLYRQATLTRRDIAAVKPQAMQIIQAYNQNLPGITNFVAHLIVYGQTHADFQRQILDKYRITPQSIAPPKK